MEHTGFGLNNETIECSNGVEHYAKRNKKWTHWAQPACVEGGVTPTPPGPTPTPTPPSGKAIVTGTMVAIRQGPSTGTAVMTRVKTGEIVDLITVEGWTYVRCGDKYGFMMNEFISINDTSVVVTGKKVALRQGTNTSSKVLDRIKTGTVVPREPLPDGWAYVRYGNKQGFMMKEFIKEG